MKTWQTTDEVWLDGNRIEVGSKIMLSPSQSKYLAHALTEPKAEKAPEPEQEVVPEPDIPDEPEDTRPIPFLKPRRQRPKDAEHGDID